MRPRPFTVIDAAIAIRRRWRLVAIVFFFVVFVVGLFTVLCDKTYLSDARIFVRLGRENSALDVTAGLGGNQIYAVPLNRDAEINSIAQMISNKDLFGRVVDKIGSARILEKPHTIASTNDNDDGLDMVDSLMRFCREIGLLSDLSDRERAIIKLQKNVDVETSEKSNVILVAFETYEPSLAQEVVAEIVCEYSNQHVRTHRPQGSLDFLTLQTEEAKKTLHNHEKLFEEFKSQTRLISVVDQRKVMVDRIAKIKNELLDTEALASSAEAEVDSLQDLTEGLSKSQPVQSKKGAGNEGIDGMRQELFRLQVLREETLAKYPAGSPRVIQVEQQLAAAKKIFESAESSLIENVEGPNRVYEGAKLEMVQKRPALNALESKYAALQKQLEDVRSELADFNANETEFNRLQRQVQISDEIYKSYKRSLEQASMDKSLEEGNLSNLSIFQVASFNPKPYRPQKLVNLIAALFLGLFTGCSLAILLEYRDQYLNRAPELEATLGIPVVATIPRQSRSSLLEAS